MNVLQITITLFLVLESLNILVLYTNPSTKKGNGVGIFKVIHDLDHEERVYPLVKYLITWVANAKLIFVALGIVVVVFGDETIQLYASIAFVFSILIFYVTLYPILVQLDKKGELTPKGYSKTLAIMILVFVLIFVVGIAIYLLTK